MVSFYGAPMSYNLLPSDPTLTDALQRIAAEQLDKARSLIEDEDGETLAETIHEVRKCAKKTRGLLRLVRPALPAYSKENRTLRDAARRLSPLRDRGALIEAYDRLLDHFSDDTARAPFASLRGALTRDQNGIAADPETYAELKAFRKTVKKLRKRVDKWKLTEKDDTALALGLAMTYGRAVAATRAAGHAPDEEALHEWRKRAKYHRYHTQILQPVWPEVLDLHLEQVKRLEDLLGEHRDLSLLSAAARDRKRPMDRSARSALTGYAETRQAQILAESVPLAQRLFSEDPEALADRWITWYRTWRGENR